VGHVERAGKVRNIYIALLGKPERKRPLEKRRHRWKDKIIIGLWIRRV
jgi:hypothetical protein